MSSSKAGDGEVGLKIRAEMNLPALPGGCGAPQAASKARLPARAIAGGQIIPACWSFSRWARSRPERLPMRVAPSTPRADRARATHRVRSARRRDAQSERMLSSGSTIDACPLHDDSPLIGAACMRVNDRRLDSGQLFSELGELGNRTGSHCQQGHALRATFGLESVLASRTFLLLTKSA
jgi:hypothetical protein